MDGYRRAALALHGLGETDQLWLLGRLQDAERSRLGKLVDELQMLGIPADSALLAEAKGVKRAQDAKDADVAPRPAPGRLHEAAASAVVAVLADEPASLIAALLRAGNWPWQKKFLARLDPRLREMVLAQLQSRTPTSERRSAALVSCIEARLERNAEAALQTRSGRFVAWTARRARSGRQALSSVVGKWIR